MSSIDSNADLTILLADLDMPNWEALVRHAKSVMPGLFIVGMVGWQTTPALPELQRQGIHTCLAKPLVFEDMRQTIHEYLTGNSLK
jgi:DNA-binding NtrC family response regulator